MTEMNGNGHMMTSSKTGRSHETIVHLNTVGLDGASHVTKPHSRKPSSAGTKKGAALVFKDVCVTLNKNEILKKVYGMAKVGQMLAVMGPSGAGKSTLLNTLTGRISVTSGHVTLNDQPVNRHLRRKISYVMQQDVFYPNLTLRETLTFTTLLRLPGSMSHELKMARMQEIVDALELNKCLNTRMGGTFVTGLSGGEKKRASIACELLTNPKLLILDEPTSGLDSAIAYSLMSTLFNYANLSHKTVVTTIHQPSSQIFYMFTNILLLNDGQVAYFGPANKIVGFFERLGMVCEPHYNPADFILEQVKSGSENAQKLVQAANQLRHTADWPEELRDKPIQESGNEPTSGLGKYERVVVVDEPDVNYSDGEVTVFGVIDHNDVTVQQDRVTSRPRHETDIDIREIDVESYFDPDATFQTGFLIQYTTLTKRNFLRQRHRYFSKLNFGQVLFMSLFAGLMWFQTTRAEETAKDRLGILFFTVVQFGFLPAMDAVTALNDDTGVFMRERSAGLFRLSAYFLAVMTTEIPVTFVLPTLYTLINYFMVRLMPGAVNFIGFWLILVLSTFAAQSIGMLISVLITSRAFVMSFSNTFMIASLLAGGYYNTHVNSWFKWIRYLSFLTYSLSGLAKMEFRYGDPFKCDPRNTAFPLNCTSTLNSNNETVSLLDGQLLLESWDLSFTPLYADVVALFIVVIVCRCAAYFILRYLRRPKT